MKKKLNVSHTSKLELQIITYFQMNENIARNAVHQHRKLPFVMII